MKLKQSTKKTFCSTKKKLGLLCFVFLLMLLPYTGLNGAVNGNMERSREAQKNTGPRVNETENIASTQAQNNFITEIGGWGYGPAYNAVVEDNILYMGNGRMLQIFDITSPTSRTMLSELRLKGGIHTFAVKGDYLYAVVNDFELQVINISDPAHPAAAGYLCTQRHLANMVIEGNYIYLNCDSGYFKIMDISTPQSPVEISSIQIQGLGKTSIYGDYAFVSGGTNGVRIIDVSSPDTPMEISYFNVDSSNETRYVYEKDGYLYVLGNDFRVYSLQNPESPVLLSASHSIHTNGSGFYSNIRVSPDGNLAYAVAYKGDVYVLDVSNKTLPVLTGFLESDIKKHRIFLKDDILYMSCNEDGVRVLDLSTPSDPRELDVIPAYGFTWELRVKRNHVFLAGDGSGVLVLDISNPSQPQQIAKLAGEPDGYVRNIELFDNHLYLDYSYWTTKVYDISTPASPMHLGSFSTPFRSIFVRDDYAIVAAGSSGIRILDVSNPSNISLAYSMQGAAYFDKIRVRSNYAYFSDDYSLYFYDISNPTAPFYSGTIGGVYQLLDYTLKGRYAYLLTWDEGLLVFDVEDSPGAPPIGQYGIEQPQKIEIIGNNAFVGSTDFGDQPGFISVIDISEPASPRMVENTPIDISVWDMQIADGTAYVANLYAGFTMYDVSAYSPSLRLTAPNGGEQWESYSEHDIAWTSENLAGRPVKLEYSADNGENWIGISESEPNTGTYRWTVPAGSSAQCLVRVSEVDGAATDTGDGNFEINTLPAPIELTSPVGGEDFFIETPARISWAVSDGFSGPLNISLYKNDVFYRDIAVNVDAGPGFHDWSAGLLADGTYAPSGNDYKIKITFGDGPGDSVISPAPFTLTAVTFTVLSPNGGEVLQKGAAYDITWRNPDLTSPIIISLFKNGEFYNRIASNVDPAAGSYAWTAGTLEDGTEAPSGSDYTVKIVVDSDRDTYDFSDENFTITGGSLRITSPGAQTWYKWESKTITWEASGNLASNLIISLFDNGEFYKRIASDIDPAAGSFQWEVGKMEDGTYAAPSSLYTIKIVVDADRDVYDFSSPYLAIYNSRIKVTSPRKNSEWNMGETLNITWDVTGKIPGKVIISLCEHGNFYKRIASNVDPAAGSFAWKAGKMEDGTYTTEKYWLTIKITVDDFRDTYDYSDEYFEIQGKPIEITSPNHGYWDIGTTKAITWTVAEPFPGNAIISLFKNGSFYKRIKSGVDPSAGSFTWTVGQMEDGTTAPPGSWYKIKIVLEDNLDIYDFSNYDMQLY